MTTRSTLSTQERRNSILSALAVSPQPVTALEIARHIGNAGHESTVKLALNALVADGLIGSRLETPIEKATRSLAAPVSRNVNIMATLYFAPGKNVLREDPVVLEPAVHALVSSSGIRLGSGEQKIIERLSATKGKTVRQISRGIAVTDVRVRQILAKLEDKGLITSSPQRKGAVQRGMTYRLVTTLEVKNETPVTETVAYVSNPTPITEPSTSDADKRRIEALQTALAESEARNIELEDELATQTRRARKAEEKVNAMLAAGAR